MDHKTKSVFNGSDLGKEYSAKAILEKCRPESTLEPNGLTHKSVNEKHIERHREQTVYEKQQDLKNDHQSANIAISPAVDYVPHQLKKKRKKKRKRVSI